MPDFFDQQPNYVNPDYASPTQRATALAYAKSLMEKSNTPVNYGAWTQGLANMLNAGMGGYETGKINHQEGLARQAYSQKLLEAVQNKNVPSAIGAVTDPNATDAQVEMVAGMLPKQGQKVLGPEPSISGIDPESGVFGSPAGPGNAMPPLPPVNRSLQQPSTTMAPQPFNPNDVPTGRVMPPGQNITGPGIKTDVQMGPMTGGPSAISPRDRNTLDELQKIKVQNLSQNTAATSEAGALSEDLHKTTQEGLDAANKLTLIPQLRRLSEKIGTGGALTGLREMAGQYGFHLGPNDTEMQAWSKAIHQMVPQAGSIGMRLGGPIVNEITGSFPQLTNTLEGRSRILDQLESVHKRQFKAAQISLDQSMLPADRLKKVLNLGQEDASQPVANADAGNNGGFKILKVH